MYVTTPSLQDGSLGSSRHPHICPRLVYWKVGQWENRQRLVRFSSRSHLVTASHTPRSITHRYDAHADILAAQFSRPTNDGLTQDGYSDYFNFSTGRRVVASLHTVFTLRPRHDPLQIIYQFLFGLYDFSYSPSDIVTLDFKLHPTAGAPDGVFAVVRKEELRTIKHERWDLVSANPTRISPSNSTIFLSDLHQDD